MNDNNKRSLYDLPIIDNTNNYLPHGTGTIALVRPGKAHIQYHTERQDNVLILTASLVWIEKPTVAIVKNVDAPDERGEAGE